jgi:hypothetical protein
VLLFLIPWLVYVTFLASSGDVKVSCIKMSASGMLDQANSAYQMAEAASEGETYEEEATCEEGDLLYKTMAYVSLHARERGGGCADRPPST